MQPSNRPRSARTVLDVLLKQTREGYARRRMAAAAEAVQRQPCKLVRAWLPLQG